MDQLISVALLLICVVKAIMPETHGWESAILFAVAYLIYLYSIQEPYRAPDLPELIDLQNQMKKLSEEQAILQQSSVETKKVADEAKELMAHTKFAVGFKRREERRVP